MKKLQSHENELDDQIRTDMRDIESRVSGKVDMLLKFFPTDEQGRILISDTRTTKPAHESIESESGSKQAEKLAIREPEPKPSQMPDITPRLNPKDIAKQLDKCLNSSEFCTDIWRQFDEPFYICRTNLSKYLSEKGIAKPIIEAYPPLKEDNPNTWKLMIVQAPDWSGDQLRYVIPRNFERYDPQWHSHLFNIRGSSNRAENFINGLYRCPVLASGELLGFISPALIEAKGEISISDRESFK